MIDTGHPKLSVAKQCELLSLPRSTYYHRPKPTPAEDLALMRVIDETYLAFPFFGTRQMTRWLQRESCEVNRKRVRRLMRVMGLTAIYRRSSLSKKTAAHPIYPYLLRDLSVERSNQVWGDRHHLHPGKRRCHLSVRGDRLAQPVRAGLGTGQHPRCVLLRASGAAGHGDARQTGDLQHRSRQPVYQRGVHPAAFGRRRETVDGRQRPVPGQRLRRTALAQPQIRGSLPQTLRVGGRCAPPDRRVPALL